MNSNLLEMIDAGPLRKLQFRMCPLSHQMIGFIVAINSLLPWIQEQ